MKWFMDYFLESQLVDNEKFNNYINKLSNKCDEKVIESKINQIEQNYNDKLKEVEGLCKNQNGVNELKQKSSLIILQKELDLIKLLTKYTLQNKNLNYDFYVSCLNILLELSEILRLRIGQKEIKHETINQNTDPNKTIIRCSYKFCSYQDACNYNYNAKTKNLCYQDHYVHNMVSADLKILLNYIKNNYENSKIISHNKEILKTINTLSFVISHMETELRTKCLYLPENEWESCHFVKNK